MTFACQKLLQMFSAKQLPAVPSAAAGRTENGGETAG